jgi:hypothetical protein
MFLNLLHKLAWYPWEIQIRRAGDQGPYYRAA